MSYDAWKLASPEEGVDLGDWESDAETAVEELCVHGEHPIECSLCTSAGFIAAVSGEEEDVRPTEDQDHQDAANEARQEPEAELYEQAINILSELGPQRVAALKNACEIELRKWDERNALERRQIDAAMGKRTRSGRRTRSDAGTTRPRKTEAA